MSKPRIERIVPDSLPKPAGHYSPGVAYGDLVFVSGQLPVKADGTHDPAAPFEIQVERTLANVFAVLAAAGSGPERVLKVTAYVVGADVWPAFNRVYAGWFGDARPARAVVPVPSLHHGYLVEIEAIATRAEVG
jgi:2-iminobutanoate/2-iminopropanoate deaminase